MGYWDDYNGQRPGTAGGEQANLERHQFLDSSPPIAPVSGIPESPVRPQTPAITRRPRVKRPLTKIDFIISGVAFLVTWMMLAASTSMDTGAAITAAVFASAIAGMWWRSLVVVAIVVVGAIVLISVLK